MNGHTTYPVVRQGVQMLPGITAKESITVGKLKMALMAIYIMPLLVIAYLFMEYIFPMFDANGEDVAALGLSAVLSLAVILSILGLALISKSAKDSVESLNNINVRMDSLLSLTKRFEETSYVDTLVDSVAGSAKDMLEAEASSLLLYDDAGDLRFEYVEGPASGTLKGKTVKPGEGIVGWAAREREPLIVNDVRSDPRFAGKFDKQSGFITRSVACVPLVFSGRDLGVIEVINKKDNGGFTETDKLTLMSLSEHAAAAIYKNKTYDEMKSDFVQLTEVLVMAMDSPIPEKKGHSRRVARYAVKLAKALGLKENEVRDIYFGALLHDVGLLKFPITECSDKEKYKLHPAYGGEIVKNISQWKGVARIIHDHHEWYDGTGYPSGVGGDKITIGGRIIALAEAFDVMTSQNSYKQPVSFDEAVEEIRSFSGTQFDPVIASAFLENFSKDDLDG